LALLSDKLLVLDLARKPPSQLSTWQTQLQASDAPPWLSPLHAGAASGQVRCSQGLADTSVRPRFSDGAAGRSYELSIKTSAWPLSAACTLSQGACLATAALPWAAKHGSLELPSASQNFGFRLTLSGILEELAHLDVGLLIVEDFRCSSSSGSFDIQQCWPGTIKQNSEVEGCRKKSRPIGSSTSSHQRLLAQPRHLDNPA
jgi:hypothetical protein